MIEVQLALSALVDLAKAGFVALGVSFPVYRTDVPAGVTPGYPFLVGSLVDGGGFSGPPLRDPAGDVWLVIQWDAVGNRDDQALLAADRMRRVMVERNPDGSFMFPLTPHLPANTRECDRIPDGGPGAPIPTPPASPGSTRLYTVPQRYAVHLTPA